MGAPRVVCPPRLCLYFATSFVSRCNGPFAAERSRVTNRQTGEQITLWDIDFVPRDRSPAKGPLETTMSLMLDLHRKDFRLQWLDIPVTSNKDDQL